MQVGRACACACASRSRSRSRALPLTLTLAFPEKRRERDFTAGGCGGCAAFDREAGALAAEGAETVNAVDDDADAEDGGGKNSKMCGACKGSNVIGSRSDSSASCVCALSTAAP